MDVCAAQSYSDNCHPAGEACSLAPLMPTVLSFQNLSTSPLAEPPHFVEHIRSTLMFLKKFPSPANILFPGNKALLYKKNEDGLWEKISSPGS